MNARRQILLLSSRSLRVYLQQGRHLVEDGCFARHELDAFRRHLAVREPLPACVLADLVEEEFRIEELPHTIGRDRRALLERHAVRLYRNTPFRHARVIGRSESGRRRDEALFGAITNPDAVEPWLAALAEHRVPVAGIWSLPLLTHSLMRAVGHGVSDLLVVTENRDSGLRQTFFHRGKLKFSRLSPVPELADADYPEFVHGEIGRTKRYLGNLHLLEPDVLLDVAILSGGDRQAQLARAIDAKGLDHYHLYEIAQVGRQMGYRGTLDTPCCDLLFGYLLASRRPANHYAPPEHRRHYRTWLARQGLQAASVLLATGALLWSGINVSDGLTHARQADMATRATAEARQRFEAARARVPATPVSPDEIETAVLLADTLEAQRARPEPVLVPISQTLDHYPELELQALRWFASDDPAATGLAAASHGQDYQEEVFTEPETIDAAPQRYQIALIEGRIAPFDGNYLRAHARIARFVTALAARPGVVRAEAVKLPLNLDPSDSVGGGIGGRQTNNDARFTVRVVMQHEAPQT